MKSIIDLSYIPWGNAYYATDACGQGPYSSDERHCWTKRCVEVADAPSDCFTAGHVVTQHPEPEKAINFLEACAIKLNPHWQTYWPFVQCMEDKFAADAAESCAKSAGIDYKALHECATGPDGEAAEKEFAKATPDHPGVPYILVNGKAIDDPSNLLKAVCDAYTGTKPSGCSESSLKLTVTMDHQYVVLI